MTPAPFTKLERERFVEDLLSYMTLEEKLGQLDLQHPASDPAIEAAIAAGRIGGVAGDGPAQRFQTLAIERSRLGIPLLLIDDCVAMEPSPWAVAASWDAALLRTLGGAAARTTLYRGQNSLAAPRVALGDHRAAEGIVHIATDEPHLAAQLAAAFAAGAGGTANEGDPVALAIPSASGARCELDLRWAQGLIRDGGLAALDCEPLAGEAAARAGFSGLLVAECRRLRAIVMDRYGSTSARSTLEAAERAIAEGHIAESEIDAAIRGVLGVKHALGLFRNGARTGGALAVEAGANPAADAARRTMVLLRNEAGLLPLSPVSDRVLVVGMADGAAGACGDALGRAGIGHSLAPGLAQRRPGEPWHDSAAGDDFALSLTRDAAQRADFVLVVLDERHFQVEEGRRWQRPTPATLAMLRALSSAGTGLAAIVATGEPMDLAEADQHFAAVLLCWRPGPGFEEALSDVLCGRHSPQGRLPVTAGRYALGHGLGFGESVFSGYRLEPRGDHVSASVRVRNAGSFAARETVQVYRRQGDDTLQLIAYEHVTLAPGEDAPVTFELGLAELGTPAARGRIDLAGGVCEILLGKSLARLLPATVEITPVLARAMVHRGGNRLLRAAG